MRKSILDLVLDANPIPDQRPRKCDKCGLLMPVDPKEQAKHYFLCRKTK